MKFTICIFKVFPNTVVVMRHISAVWLNYSYLYTHHLDLDMPGGTPRGKNLARPRIMNANNIFFTYTRKIVVELFSVRNSLIQLANLYARA